MRDITFYDRPYADDAECDVFSSGSGGLRGIGFYVNGVPIVDAWLDDGEDPAVAEQALRDMCVLRQGGA